MRRLNFSRLAWNIWKSQRISLLWKKWSVCRYRRRQMFFRDEDPLICSRPYAGADLHGQVCDFKNQSRSNHTLAFGASGFQSILIPAFFTIAWMLSLHRFSYHSQRRFPSLSLPCGGQDGMLKYRGWVAGNEWSTMTYKRKDYFFPSRVFC